MIRPMVLFESDSDVYGLNGAASGVGGYVPIRRISDENVMRFNGPFIIGEWIKAGLSLCNGDRDSALIAIDRAYTLIAEPFPIYPLETELTPEELLRRQRIFRGKVACEDRAYEAMRNSGIYPQELEDECVEDLLETEKSNSAELSDIIDHGIFENWPLD